MRRKVIVVGVMGCFVALVAAGVSMAQPPQGPGGRGMFDPAQMRQMMEQRMKEQLGCTDAEWQVLGPRLTKVMTLSRQTQMGGGMGRMFMRGRRGQGGQECQVQGKFSEHGGRRITAVPRGGNGCHDRLVDGRAGPQARPPVRTAALCIGRGGRILNLECGAGRSPGGFPPLGRSAILRPGDSHSRTRPPVGPTLEVSR